MSDELYELTIKNLPYQQATALYRFLVNLADEEPLHGDSGLSWSGQIPGKDRQSAGVINPERTVDIRPMRLPGREDTQDRLAAAVEYLREHHEPEQECRWLVLGIITQLGMTAAKADEFAQRVLGDLEPEPGESAQQYHERCLTAREKLAVAARADMIPPDAPFGSGI